MKYLFSILLTLMLGFSPAFAGEDIAVTLYGDDSYPPYSFLNKGKIEGIYPHIMQQVAERIEGYDIKITLLPWKRALRLAKKGQIFAVFPPYYLPDRRPYFSEYSVPILPEETIAYCAKSILIPPRPRWPEDYYGLTIGNNLGFDFYGEKVDQAMHAGKIKLENTPGTKNNILKLLAGRIDCYINDRISILWNVRQMKKQGKWPYDRELAEGTVLDREYGYLAFSGIYNAPYREDFIRKFNTIILQMQSSGEIDRIAQEFIQ